MRRILAITLGFGLLGTAVAAETDGWVPMTGAQISEALTGRGLNYGAANQLFFASGRTFYRAGAGESWGKWRVEVDRYCSQWPPSDNWACYDMYRSGDQFRFVDDRGNTTEGSLTE